MSVGAWGGRGGGGFSGGYQRMAARAFERQFQTDFKYKLKGTCQVCSYNVFVLLLDKEDFVAKYYHLTEDENEVCTECWMKAKAHDPEKDKFTVKFTGYGTVKNTKEEDKKPPHPII